MMIAYCSGRRTHKNERENDGEKNAMTMSATCHKGPLGSTFYALQADSETVVRLASIDWSREFSRVCIDHVRGLIVCMSPSWHHEKLGKLIEDVVDQASDALGQFSESFRATRYRAPSDPPGTGLEPDCSFIVGDKVEGYLDALKAGEAAVDDYLERTPPDLVVEVELTHFDRGKAMRYGQIGVREFWQVRVVGEPTEVSIEILQLDPRKPPEPVRTSQILSGLTSRQVAEAVAAVSTARTRSARTEAVSNIVLGKGAMRVQEEQECYSP